MCGPGAQVDRLHSNKYHTAGKYQKCNRNSIDRGKYRYSQHTNSLYCIHRDISITSGEVKHGPKRPLLVNKDNNIITELRPILQRESQNS